MACILLSTESGILITTESHLDIEVICFPDPGFGSISDQPFALGASTSRPTGRGFLSDAPAGSGKLLP